MKIAVLNGSPKGMVSVTVQYVRFLQKKFPRDEFTIVHACHDIKRFEEDRAALDAAVETVRAADAVLWATPVYVLLVPGAYKRFIELLFERSAQSAFQGKYAAVLTTSVRFFDHTAVNYLNAVSDDLDMHFVGAYSAEMFVGLLLRIPAYRKEFQRRLKAEMIKPLEAVVDREEGKDECRSQTDE